MGNSINWKGYTPGERGALDQNGQRISGDAIAGTIETQRGKSRELERALAAAASAAAVVTAAKTAQAQECEGVENLGENINGPFGERVPIQRDTTLLYRRGGGTTLQSNFDGGAWTTPTTVSEISGDAADPTDITPDLLTLYKQDGPNPQVWTRPTTADPWAFQDWLQCPVPSPSCIDYGDGILYQEVIGLRIHPNGTKAIGDQIEGMTIFDRNPITGELSNPQPIPPPAVDLYEGKGTLIDGNGDGNPGDGVLYIKENDLGENAPRVRFQNTITDEWFPEQIAPSALDMLDVYDGDFYTLPDGTTVLFSSSRPGGFGGSDIWQADCAAAFAALRAEVDPPVGDPDAGTPDPDAGTPDPDAGSGDPPDAGVPDPDASPDDPDAGVPPSDGGVEGESEAEAEGEAEGESEGEEAEGEAEAEAEGESESERPTPDMLATTDCDVPGMPPQIPLAEGHTVRVPRQEMSCDVTIADTTDSFATLLRTGGMEQRVEADVLKLQRDRTLARVDAMLCLRGKGEMTFTESGGNRIRVGTCGDIQAGAGDRSEGEYRGLFTGGIGTSGTVALETGADGRIGTHDDLLTVRTTEGTIRVCAGHADRLYSMCDPKISRSSFIADVRAGETIQINAATAEILEEEGGGGCGCSLGTAPRQASSAKIGVEPKGPNQQMPHIPDLSLPLSAVLATGLVLQRVARRVRNMIRR